MAPSFGSQEAEQEHFSPREALLASRLKGLRLAVSFTPRLGS